ncbi:hypothetical protein CDAR_622711, partial [Caerostris darwini]
MAVPGILYKGDRERAAQLFTHPPVLVQ